MFFKKDQDVFSKRSRSFSHYIPIFFQPGGYVDCIRATVSLERPHYKTKPTATATHVHARGAGAAKPGKRQDVRS